LPFPFPSLPLSLSVSDPSESESSVELSIVIATLPRGAWAAKAFCIALIDDDDDERDEVEDGMGCLAAKKGMKEGKR
jgi:hypothetical protein